MMEFTLKRKRILAEQTCKGAAGEGAASPPDHDEDGDVATAPKAQRLSQGRRAVQRRPAGQQNAHSSGLNGSNKLGKGGSAADQYCAGAVCCSPDDTAVSSIAATTRALQESLSDNVLQLAAALGLCSAAWWSVYWFVWCPWLSSCPSKQWCGLRLGSLPCDAPSLPDNLGHWFVDGSSWVGVGCELCCVLWP